MIKPRKVLLAQKIAYVGTHGGANKANRVIAELLVRAGIVCRVIVPMRSMHDQAQGDALERHLKRRNISFYYHDEVLRFTIEGVEVHAVQETTAIGNLRSSRLINHLREQIRDFEPDYVLIASEDQGQRLLKIAYEDCADRTFYLARSSSMTGIGPLCFFPNPEMPHLLRSIAGVVSNSDYLRKYILRWSGRDSIVFDPPTYADFPGLPRSKCQGAVTLINPCKVKGIDIFLQLAQALPHLCFMAVPTWGTTELDRCELDKYSNVSVVRARDNIHEILADTAILLVPSLWDESFGRVAVEGMLEGVPTVVSNLGGLPEAKLGIPFVLPVTPIERYKSRFDGRYVCEPYLPQQDISLWRETVESLSAKPDLYRLISQQSSHAAKDYVNTLSIDTLTDFMCSS